MRYLQDITLADAALIAGGVVTFFVAAFILWSRNWGWRDRERPPAFSFPGVGRVSEPTRLLAGCFGMVLAYHLVVWALPAWATPFQFPRSRWWVVVVVGSGAMGGSLLMDRRERAAGGGVARGEDAPE